VARVVLTARLLEGARERALELSASVADPGAVGIDRLSVYLSESEVIFVIEGSDGEASGDGPSTIPSARPSSARGYRCSTARSTARPRSITGLARPEAGSGRVGGSNGGSDLRAGVCLRLGATGCTKRDEDRSADQRRGAWRSGRG
jgi:hypothetical protein